MQVDGIIIINSYSGLPLYSKLDSTINDTLFSGFISAIRNFAKEISLGGLSSFNTEQMNVNLVARNKVLVALLSAKDVDIEKATAYAFTLGERFEEEFVISDNNPNIDQYQRFDDIIDELNNRDDIPFIIPVSEFAKKEFGGELSIQPKLINRDKKEVVVDLILDRGKKKGLFSKLVKSFSEDVTFAKVIDGIGGRGEIQDFLDQLKTFGALRSKTIDDDEYPFYPSRGVIIARDYSPTVDEVLDKLDRTKGKANLPGTHIAFDAGMPGAPSAAKCFIELWKWKDDGYPERIFN
ncbi:MAG: hypothetical protein INQ03_22435 [Candidatus Heimdallarchaeota archaeon]|nr:hypothetical protein [Candidatus Heimdallarchaeota archaeon]